MHERESLFEYLIIAFGIAIIAAIFLAFVGWVPFEGQGITSSESRQYWSAATPFSISSFKVNPYGNIALVLMNNSAEELQVTGVKLNGKEISLQATLFAPGEVKAVPVQTLLDPALAGTPFSFNVEITYKGNVSGNQIGIKPLVGVYS